MLSLFQAHQLQPFTQNILQARNFIDSIKSRHPTAAPPEIAQRAATCCHIGAAAAEQLGTELKFDPKTEKFTNNDLANKMLMRPMREPWRLAGT